MINTSVFYEWGEGFPLSFLKQYSKQVFFYGEAHTQEPVENPPYGFAAEEL